MRNKKQASFASYIATPIMAITAFGIATLVFAIFLKNPDPVPVFIIFAFIQMVCMILFAILPPKRKQAARISSMFIIGLFIFVLAGILGRNNFQIESFFLYLLSGTMGGVLVHYFVGKILGPLVVGRTWFSWGCWTTMILDLLPYKTSTSWKKGNVSRFRYVHFILSFCLVIALFFGLKWSFISNDPQALKAGTGTLKELIWFLAGNGLYYLTAIALAIGLKDNRAFCKYICPITVFLKNANRFALLRIKGEKELCDNCRTCTSVCPMSIEIPKYVAAGERVKSTECIMCMKCIASCPNGALASSVGLDVAVREYLR